MKIFKFVLIGISISFVLGCYRSEKPESRVNITPRRIARGQSAILTLSSPVEVGKGIISAGISPGGGITTGKAKKKSRKKMTVKVNIAEDAPLGPRILSVDTPNAMLDGEIEVVEPESRRATFQCDVKKISPGDEKQVHVFGVETQFNQNSQIKMSSTSDLSISISKFKVVDSLTAQFFVSVDEEAEFGPRMLSIVTGSEIATGSIVVSPYSDDMSLSIAPETIKRGERVDFVIRGYKTNFNADTWVSFGPNAGIAVSNIDVQNETEISFVGEVARDAVPGKKTLYVSGPSGQDVEVLAVDVTVLEAVTCYRDAYENSDDPYDPPSLNFPVNINASICPGDHDYYKINIQAGVEIDFLALFNHADGDLDIELWEHPYSLGKLLRTSTTRTDNEFINFAAPLHDSGERILHVFGKSGAINNYTLNADLSSGSSCTDDAYEPNDYFGAAVPISFPDNLSAVVCPNDDDYFRVNVIDPGGATLYISTSFNHSSGDLNLQLLDSTETVLAVSDSETDNEAIEYQVDGPQELTIRVYGVSGSQNTYTLNVDEDGTDTESDTETESDTDTNTTPPVCPNPGFTVTPSELSVGRYAARLTLAADDNPAWLSGQAAVTLPDAPENISLEACTITTPWQISCNITVGLFATPGEIRLDVTQDVEPRCGALAITADNITEATIPDSELPSVKRYSGDIDVLHGDRSDFYHVAPSAKGLLVFHAYSLDRENMDPVLRLIEADGNTWRVYKDDETPLGIDSRMAYYFAEAGDFYVEVGPKFNRTHGEYDFFIYRMTHGRTLLETAIDNDTLETAQVIVPDMPYMIYGAISEQGDADVYRVTTHDAAAIDVVARRLGPWDGALADVTLRIYNESFELVGENAAWFEAPTSADPRVFVPDAGTYYVEVVPTLKDFLDQEEYHTGFYAINVRNQVVINEVDNRDISENPFIELLGPPNLNLLGYSLVVYDDAGTPVSTVALDDVVIKGSGYVYVSAMVPTPIGDTLVLVPGSGAVALMQGDAILDSVRFGQVNDVAIDTEGHSAQVGERRVIGRGAGVDTNNNDYDFIYMANPTPGAPNDRTFMSPIALYGEPDTCRNLDKDGDETDMDCGGPCSPCGDGMQCQTDSDCKSDACEDGICQYQESCSDLRTNQDESDVDCGGTVCPLCPNGALCNTDADCASNYCDIAGICDILETCDDDTKNQDETDVDCGGSICPACQDGDSCALNDDCLSEDCALGTCVRLVGMVNVYEDGGNWYCVEFSVTNTSDIYIPSWDMLLDTKGFSNFGNIWGMTLSEENGIYRATPTEIWNMTIDASATVGGMGYCVYNVSGDYYPEVVSTNGADHESCDDHVANQDETDVDCGGSICPKCHDGDSCMVDSDCLSGDCESNICTSILVGMVDVIEDGGDWYCAEFYITNIRDIFIPSWDMLLNIKGFSNFGDIWGMTLSEESGMYRATPNKVYNMTIDPEATVGGMGYCIYDVSGDYYPEIASANVG